MNLKISRPTLTFPKIVQYCGLGIAIYETVVDKVERPSLLILAAGMMGLDQILKAQHNDFERERKEDKDVKKE